jgi:ribulose kinase
MEELIRIGSRELAAAIGAQSAHPFSSDVNEREETGGVTGQFDDALTNNFSASAAGNASTTDTSTEMSTEASTSTETAQEQQPQQLDAKGRPMVKVGQEYVTQTMKVKVDGAMKEVRIVF